MYVSIGESTRPRSVETAVRRLADDRPMDAVRDADIAKLAAAYDGYLFDLEGGSRQALITPDLKDSFAGDDPSGAFRYSQVVASFVRPMTEDWKSILGIMPEVGVTPLDSSPSSQQQADFLENIHRGIWTDSDLHTNLLHGAHWLSLFGSEILRAVPDPKDKRVRINVESPYRAHARPAKNGRDLLYVAFEWDEQTVELLDEYPDLAELLPHEKRGGKLFYDEQTVVTEYMDAETRLFLVGESDIWIEDMPYLDHNWGIVPAVVVPNMVGTGSIWGRPDAQMVVHLSQVVSEVLSLGLDALYEHVHDKVLVFDDNEVRQIEGGPREWLQFSSNAQVKMLHSQSNVPEISAVMGILERMARLSSGWPEVLSSEIDSSIPTGKAIVALQGPVAARAAIKHTVLARKLARVSSMALWLYERLFPRQEVRLPMIPGSVSTNVMPTAARNGSQLVTFQPKKDIAGRYDCVLSYPPAGMDDYKRTVQLLQWAEAEVISLEYVQEQISGVNKEIEVARLDRQYQRKAEREVAVQTMLKQAEMQAQMQMMGAAGMAPPAAGGGGAPPQAPQPSGGPAAGATPAAGAPTAQPAAQPMGPAQTSPAPAGQAGNAGERVQFQEVRQAILGVSPIRGEVWLMGRIVSLGWTDGPINVGVTNRQDKGTIISQTVYGQQKRYEFIVLRPGEAPKDAVLIVSGEEVEEQED